MITVLGSASLDQIGTVPRLPKPGETISGGTFAMAPGGKGANQALAARRAGADVRFFGAVGSDAFAAPATALLTEDGVDLTHLRRVSGPTGIAMIFVEASGENAIAVLPGANATLSPADAEAALAGLGEGAIVMLQQEIDQRATERALQLGRAGGLTTILNTAPFLDATPRLARLATILVANESEFALLNGGAEGPLEAQITRWAADNDQTVIVTLGAEGVRAATRGESFYAPAHRVTPVDTVGAGDTFCGYLAAGLDAGLELATAMRRAAVAASLACLKPGAQPAIPFAARVDTVVSTSPAAGST